MTICTYYSDALKKQIQVHWHSMTLIDLCYLSVESTPILSPIELNTIVEDHGMGPPTSIRILVTKFKPFGQ